MAQIPPEQRALAQQSLPGMRPVEGADWTRVDAAFDAQLAQKAALIATRPADVMQVLPMAHDAVQELREVVVALRGGRVAQDVPPLIQIAQLIQEDVCILQKHGESHVLTAALLCFPAGWTLAEKIGRPLVDIHGPVASYNANVARRVQRLFDGVRVGQPLWRANLLRYDDPELFQPHPEAAPRTALSANPSFERSERQTLVRLPRTDAVVFAIHTSVQRAADRAG